MQSPYPPPASRSYACAFSLIELLAAIAIIVILATILIPALGRLRDSAATTKCVSNLRNVGAALHIYANDNQDQFPPPYYANSGACWMWPLAMYIGLKEDAMGFNPKPRSAGALICPEFDSQAVKDRKAAYGYNINLRRSSGTYVILNRSEIEFPAQTFLLAEINGNQEFSAPVGNASTIGSVVSRHAGNTANFLFVDGHVETIELTSDLSTDPRWNPHKDL